MPALDLSTKKTFVIYQQGALESKLRLHKMEASLANKPSKAKINSSEGQPTTTVTPSNESK